MCAVVSSLRLLPSGLFFYRDMSVGVWRDEQKRESRMADDQTLSQLLHRGDQSSLDAARAHLDGLSLPAIVDEITGTLLVWTNLKPPPVGEDAAEHSGATSELSEGAQRAASARRERCRLVSYAAIMHGSLLLSHIPMIARMIVPLLGDQDGLVGEELLRMIGNLARYVLAVHSSGVESQTDMVMSLAAPFIGAAVGERGRDASYRARASLLAVHRVLLELPPELLTAEAMLPTTTALLKVVSAADGDPPVEVLAPLSRAVQFVGVHLDELSVHRLVQCAVGCLRAQGLSASNRHGAVELLRTVAPMLRARAADNEDFARSLIAWVADEIALLPELTLQQLAVRDLRAAYSTLPGTVGEDSVAVPRVQGACEPCVSSANVNPRSDARILQHPESAVSDIATPGCHTLANTGTTATGQCALPLHEPMQGTARVPTVPLEPTSNDRPDTRRRALHLPDSDLELLERMARLEKELSEIPMHEAKQDAPHSSRTSSTSHAARARGGPSTRAADPRPPNALRVGGGYQLAASSMQAAQREFLPSTRSLAFREQIRHDRAGRARLSKVCDVPVEIFVANPPPGRYADATLATPSFSTVHASARPPSTKEPTSAVEGAQRDATEFSRNNATVHISTTTSSDNSTDVHVMRGGSALGEEALLAQLRHGMRRDLDFLPPTARMTSEGIATRERQAVGREPLASIPAHRDGNIGSQSDAKRDALSALLSLRAKEIETAHHQRSQQAARHLVATYQQQVAKLQSALVRQLGELGMTSQRAIEAELQAFMQLGLPAIQHILSESSALSGKAERAQEHAATVSEALAAASSD